MTKYLTEERFIVSSQDNQSRKNYNDNYDRIFGKKEPEPLKLDGPCPMCGVVGHEVVTTPAGTFLGCPKCPEQIVVALPAVATLGKALEASVQNPPTQTRCTGCDETCCECDDHDPACAKLCTIGVRCDCEACP